MGLFQRTTLAQNLIKMIYMRSNCYVRLFIIRTTMLKNKAIEVYFSNFNVERCQATFLKKFGTCTINYNRSHPGLGESTLIVMVKIVFFSVRISQKLTELFGNLSSNGNIQRDIQLHRVVVKLHLRNCSTKNPIARSSTVSTGIRNIGATKDIQVVSCSRFVVLFYS